MKISSTQILSSQSHFCTYSFSLRFYSDITDIAVIQSPSHARLFKTPWTVALARPTCASPFP